MKAFQYQIEVNN